MEGATGKPRNRPDAAISHASRREALGTAFLLAAVVGSGIMAQRLAGGNVALALLGNTLPTGAILVVLILIFGPLSGAHFNPVVSAGVRVAARIVLADAAAYIAVQVVGGVIGVWAAHLMFELAASGRFPTTVRSGPGQWLAEFVATFGLLLTIFGCARAAPSCDRLRGWPVHHRGLLVHRLDLIRQPSRHRCALAV